MENSNKHPYLIFIAIIIAGLLVAGAIIWKNDGGLKNQPASSSSSVSEEKNKEIAETSAKKPPANVNIAGEGDDPILGDVNAPITMVIFGDFQCNFCKKLKTKVEPLIIEKYVKIGKVKIIDRDFAFLGKESIWAAEAANCAFEQNKYWEYAAFLYSVQPGHDDAVFSKDNLKSFAQKLKLNLDFGQFNNCLDSDKYLEEVKKDFEDAQALGVTGTPTTYINGEVINGAQPFEEFEKVLESML